MLSENIDNEISKYQAALEIFKVEGQLLWQRFGTFLLIHTVILAFILKAVFEQSYLFYPNQSLFATGVLGIILCILWTLTNSRAWQTSDFRTAQLFNSEPSNWNLIAGHGKEFADGKRVVIGSKDYQMNFLGKIPQKKVFNAVIGLFFLVYIVIILLSWPWRVHNTDIESTQLALTVQDKSPELALVVATFLLVAVTSIYTYINRKAVVVMRDQLNVSMRPYIIASTFVVPGNRMLCLKISNTGKTAAEDLQLELDRDFHRYGENGEVKDNLKDAYAFQNKIETFAPGSELLFYLGYAHNLFSDQVDRNLTPCQFTIEATYKYLGNKFSEKTSIDIETYKGTQLWPKEALIQALEGIAEAIGKDNMKPPH